MAQAEDTVWLPVLPSMKGFGPALVKGSAAESDKAGGEAGKRFGKALVLGVGAVGAGALATGAALYKVGEIFDDVADTIRVGTGATGKDLDGLVDVAKRVGASVPAEFEDIGATVADVNTRMGLSGETLEKVASQYLEAGRILGEEVDIMKTGAAFNAFKIEGDDVSGALDHLFQVSQATGIGINELADGVARNAPAIQALGFSFEESAAMIGSFDKAGLNSGAIMASMSKGLVTLAKDGEEPQKAFKRVVGEIDGFIKSGDEAGALNLASKVFGTKGATQFIGAMKAGTMNLEDLEKAAGQTGDTILGAGAETMDFAEQWMMFKNKILVWLEPAASAVFGAIGTLMGEITDGVTAFGAAWAANDGDITSSGIPGLMEQLAFYARQTFDYFKDTVIPNLQEFGGWLRENEGTIAAVAGVIGVLLLPIFVRLGVEALIAGGKQVASWAMSGGGAVKTAGLYVINSYKMIGAWVAMSLAAIKSGAETAAIWLMYRLDSLKAMGAMMASKVSIIGSWIAMGAAAVTSGIRTAAVWTGTIIRSAVSGAISFGIQTALVVGGWVLMGVQSLIQGARMAAAWVLAMGPVGWVIAAVIGLVALIVANWDKVSEWTRVAWEAVVGWIVGAWKNVVNFTTIYWGIVTGIFTGVVNFVKNIFAAVFTWLQDYVIKPVFLGIQLYIKAWWFVVSTIFNAVRNFVMVTLAGAFIWFRDSVIVPVFNGIRDVIKTVWEKGIKPVFDFLMNTVTKSIPEAFQKGVDGAKKIWETLLDIAKKPVRFVVDTVVNKGLIGTFNKVAKFLPGIKPLGEVVLPPGFRSGGYTGNLPWNHVAGIVHGDEQVIRAESRRSIEGRVPGFLDALNRFGASALDKAGFRTGGRVNPTKNMTLTQGYSAAHDGIDIGVGVGTPVFATGPGVVTHAGPGARAPGVWGGNEVHIKGGGIERWFAHLSQIGVKVGQQVATGQQIALSGNTGISSGPHLHFGAYSGGWPNAMDPMAYLGGAAAPTGGGGFFDPLSALHSLADGVMKKVIDAVPGGGFMVDAAAGIGKKLITDVGDWAKDKLGMGATAGPQGAHLDPLLYDQGGILRPGFSNVVNRTRDPEYILNPRQWEAMFNLADRPDGGGDTWNVQLPPDASVGDLMDEVSHRDRVNARGGANR
ncbi:phage tail tape measure protein [Arthrobacter sp. TMP15]|uniref:phage tail tape measure protein n=1 Tax=Arthrobacter sp. TMP15 TaxID=3140789 RepID=UPI0031BB377D